MPRPKKVNTENKNAEKKITQKRKPKIAEKQIAEKQNIYSKTIILDDGRTDLEIDWDKLREHIRTI